ncbi:MAG: DUF3320 domain-containing protein, partial [Planctomycetota bacterium]
AQRTVRAQIEQVLRREGPVVFERLARTVAAAWGVSRVTERVRERLRSALPATAVVDGDVVWADKQQRDTFRGFRGPADGGDAERAAEELPAPELANALRWLLRQHQALPAADLAREAARCFGIARLGNVVREVMTAAIERLVAGGDAVRGGDVVRAR